MNSALQQALATLPPEARILDCGGWFAPLGCSTHVLDLMPYETRGGRLQLLPLAGERFTRATWTQVDFLSEGLHLPYPDRYFDLCNCSHTLEDLENPFPLLSELSRICRSGVFRTPSRLMEQTVGARDRMTGRRGHPHHHWIVESDRGRVLFAQKAESLSSWWHSSVPLRLAERLRLADPGIEEWTYSWQGDIEWSILRGEAARRRAEQFAREVGATAFALFVDAAWRGLRHARYALRAEKPTRTEEWWQEMVELSRPYSSIALR